MAFFGVVNMLGSSPGSIALAMRSAQLLSHETRASVKKLKGLKKQANMVWLLQQMCFCLTFDFVNTNIGLG